MLKEIFKKNVKSRIFRAFTLAEVLITLGIIGVVASLTIPMLAQKIEANANYSKMLKAYSTLSLAAAAIRNDNSGDMTDAAADYTEMMNLFSEKIKTYKSCDYAQIATCYLAPANDIIQSPANYYLAGATTINMTLTRFPKIVSIDGYIYAFGAITPNCTSFQYARNGINEGCEIVYVDTNGEQKPNIEGKDIWAFTINKHSVTPYSMYDVDDYCNTTNSSPNNGLACAMRAIQNGKIDWY